MKPTDLEAYLHQHIPLTTAMGVSVEQASPGGVVLRAPLRPNINHRETVFGGSASALAILSGWALVHVRMHQLGHSSRRIVIQRNRMEYERPIGGDFIAECREPDAQAWDRFLRILKRRGMSRINLSATLYADGSGNQDPAGRFQGAYVVMEETEA